MYISEYNLPVICCLSTGSVVVKTGINIRHQYKAWDFFQIASI